MKRTADAMNIGSKSNEIKENFMIWKPRMALTVLFAIAIAIAIALTVCAAALAADDITGLWKGLDEETGETKMLAYLYEYQGRGYGRMVATYHEGVLREFMGGPVSDIADKWAGNPAYVGMDLIWDMEDRGSKWKKGCICDAEKGKIYGCEMWIEGENLVVRGKVGPFGGNQIWFPVEDSEIPSGLDYGNPSSWVPSAPVLKE